MVQKLDMMVVGNKQQGRFVAVAGGWSRLRRETNRILSPVTQLQLQPAPCVHIKPNLG